ncbi:MAG: zinc ribbon domain-containing protein, partial [Nitrospirota bacterium]
PELDENKMMKAMSFLEQEAQNLNEDDPKQAAQLMRKLFDTTGFNLSSKMEEALRRMEAGEDPDKIEEEMGDILGEKDIFKASPKIPHKIKRRPPKRDETLYFL